MTDPLVLPQDEFDLVKRLAASLGGESAGNMTVSPANSPGDHAACDAEITRLHRHVERLGREHARHALAVTAHKGRADQQESRAVRAEKQLARFLGYTEEYDKLAERASESRRNADLVTELRRRITILERSMARATEAERARIRRGLLGIETVLERPETGESVVAVETMALEALIGPEEPS